MVYCYNCGTTLKENYSFCVKCGEPNISTPPAKNVEITSCDTCYNQIDIGNQFCAHCGNQQTLFSTNNGEIVTENAVVIINQEALTNSIWIQADLDKLLTKNEKIKFSTNLSMYTFGIRKSY